MIHAVVVNYLGENSCFQDIHHLLYSKINVISQHHHYSESHINTLMFRNNHDQSHNRLNFPALVSVRAILNEKTGASIFASFLRGTAKNGLSTQIDWN